MQTDYLVIGAGFSGLAAARAIAREGSSLNVLEARSRVGGRAYSRAAGAAAIDLGPAWVWPRYQPLVTRLAQELNVELVSQYETGDFVFESPSGLQRGRYPKRYADARRVRGGLQGLADAMANSLPGTSINTGVEVLEVDASDTLINVRTNTGVYRTKHLICTAPGQLMSHWPFSPPLPAQLSAALRRWPTWMAAQAKIIALYDRPFWREAGLSGASGSHTGPLIETADQSDTVHGLYALFGFIGWSAQEREDDKDTLQQAVVAQLVRLFGQHAAQPQAFHVQDWAQEAFTATALDRCAGGGHPPYGEQAWSEDWYQGRVFFAGAESATTHGGLIEGALEAGERAAAQALAAGAK